MFESIVNGHRTTHRGVVPLVMSWAVHTLVIAAVVVLPLLFASDHVPAVPKEIEAYMPVAPPPPPPPPPPPSAASAAAKRASPRPAPAVRPGPQAPVVAAREIAPSINSAADVGGASGFGSAYGVVGGVPDGVPGGVIGGVVGGIPDVPLPPSPPSPPPAPRAPVRTGGQIQAPTLIKRVAPVYPPIAVNARVQGVVILEATVGLDGRVEDVEVIRSIPLFDKAAIDAVRQWVYAPLLLNGQAERFIVSVTVSFSVS